MSSDDQHRVQVDALPSACVLRRPDPAALTWERTLVQADAGRATAARRRLEATLVAAAPLAPAPSAEAPRGGAPRLLSVGWDRLGPRPTPDSLAAALSDDLLTARPPEVAPGDPPGLGPDDPGWGRAAVLVAELAGTATVRFPRAVDLVAGLGPMADDLAAAHAARVEVSVLAAGSRAVPVARREDHDVIVVALTGPLALAGPQPLTVGPGQGALVAAGGPLVVGGPDQWWAELTVTVQSPADVDAFIAASAVRRPELREAIPWDPEAVEARDGSLFGRGDVLAEALACLDVPALTAEAEAAWAARLRPVRALDGATARALVWGRVAPVVPAPGGWLVVDHLFEPSLRLGAPAVAVAVADRLVQAPPAVVEALARDEVPPQLVLGLLRAGLLGPAPA